MQLRKSSLLGPDGGVFLLSAYLVWESPEKKQVTKKCEMAIWGHFVSVFYRAFVVNIAGVFFTRGSALIVMSVFIPVGNSTTK